MKIKLAFIPILILLLSQYSYSQNKHEIGINFGITTGDLGKTVLKYGFIKGAGGLQLENSKTFGIRYFRKSSKKENRRLEIGLNYLTATLKISSDADGEPIVISRENNYNLVSVPVYINCSFWEYFYVNGGIIFDYQNSDSGDYDSFGAGFGFGLGGRYSFNKMNIYINPKLERHLFFNEIEGLLEFGIMFGIGYSF